MAKIYNFNPVDLHAGNKNAKRPVIAIYSNGKFCKFPSIHAAASLMDIPEPNIVACLKGRIKTSGGCRWRYADEFNWKDVCGGTATTTRRIGWSGCWSSWQQRSGNGI